MRDFHTSLLPVKHVSLPLSAFCFLLVTHLQGARRSLSHTHLSPICTHEEEEKLRGSEYFGAGGLCLQIGKCFKQCMKSRSAAEAKVRAVISPFLRRRLWRYTLLFWRLNGIYSSRTHNLKTFIMLHNIYVSNKRCSFELSIHQSIPKNKMHHGFHKNIVQHDCFQH